MKKVRFNLNKNKTIFFLKNEIINTKPYNPKLLKNKSYIPLILLLVLLMLILFY